MFCVFYVNQLSCLNISPFFRNSFFFPGGLLKMCVTSHRTDIRIKAGKIERVGFAFQCRPQMEKFPEYVTSCVQTTTRMNEYNRKVIYH